MKFVRAMMLTMVLFLSSQSPAEEAPTCKKCEMIREENKHKPQPPEYYEDYLQENPKAVEAKTSADSTVE